MANNCLVTKLKGTVDNSNLNFSYLDGLIVDFPAGPIFDGGTKILRIVKSITHVRVHVLTGKLYFNVEKTNEVPQDYETSSNTMHVFYPATEQTTVVLYNKFEGINTLHVLYGRVKFADFNAMRTINELIVAPSSSGAFIEGTRELIDFVKITYKNKTEYKTTAYPSLYSSGFPFKCESSQLRINGKVSNPLTINNFYIVPTTTELPGSNQLVVREGPVEVYLNDQNRTHVLTYNPTTDSVTYYGQFA